SLRPSLTCHIPALRPRAGRSRHTPGLKWRLATTGGIVNGARSAGGDAANELSVVIPMSCRLCYGRLVEGLQHLRQPLIDGADRGGYGVAKAVLVKPGRLDHLQGRDRTVNLLRYCIACGAAH